MSQKISPLQVYQDALASGFRIDHAQEQAVQAIEACYQALTKQTQPIQGVYLWGRVGRGKTWLMDTFYHCVVEHLKINARRQHFHHFMKWVHQELFRLTGQENPIQRLAKELAQDIQVLCFDEFFIQDIGDAVILSGLLIALFEEGIVFVTTSNQPPERLYENGFNRERLIPAIKAIQQHTQVISMDGELDHRSQLEANRQRYFVRDQEGFQQALKQAGLQWKQQQMLNIGTQTIQTLYLNTEQKTVCFVFSELFQKPLGAMDYMELCDQFEQIFIEQVPELTADGQQQVIARGTEDGATQVHAGDRIFNLTRSDDAARRFIAFIDECYDRHVPVYLHAQVAIEQLYREGGLLFAFQRTISRLKEMQNDQFGT